MWKEVKRVQNSGWESFGFVANIKCMSYKMMKVVEAPTQWTDHIVLTVCRISIIEKRRKGTVRLYGEFTNMPCIDVEWKDGRIGKRPLQVAGALTLPTAAHRKLRCRSTVAMCNIQSPAIE